MNEYVWYYTDNFDTAKRMLNVECMSLNYKYNINYTELVLFDDPMSKTAKQMSRIFSIIFETKKCIESTFIKSASVF